MDNIPTSIGSLIFLSLLFLGFIHFISNLKITAIQSFIIFGILYGIYIIYKLSTVY